MIQFKALLNKEIKEAFRDKKALVNALMMAFLAPVFIIVMSNMFVKKTVDKEAVYIEILGAEFAPSLIEKLHQGHIYSLDTANADDKVKWNARKITLIVPDTFSNDMNQGKVIDLVLKADMSDQSMDLPMRRIKAAVGKYSSEIGAKRLLMRGVDIQLVKPIQLLEQDLAQGNSGISVINSMIVTYLIFITFYCSMAVALDSSAGERERDVLELLLCQPVSTAKIVGSKLLAASSISVLAMGIMLSLTGSLIGFVDLSAIGASFQLTFTAVLVFFILLVPMCFFASSLQLFFAFKAKTFKEAQTTVTMLIAIPMFIPMFLMFADDKPAWLGWAPVSGHYLLMEDVLKGNAVDYSVLLVLTVSTIALAFAVFRGLSNKLKSEKVVLALS